MKALILRLLGQWLGAVLLLSTVACGESLSTAPTIDAGKPGVPSRLELSATPGVGFQGGSGTITVRVFDTFATPLPNQTVNFSVNTGTLGAAEAVTDDKGLARTTVTGPEGLIAITAAVGAVEAKTQISIQPAVAPPAPFQPTPPPPAPAPPQPLPNPPTTPVAPSINVTLTSSASSVAVGGILNFTAAATLLNAGEAITVYSWDLDGDGTFEFTSTLPNHVSGPYTKHGTTIAKVQVTSSTGRTATGTAAIIVTN